MELIVLAVVLYFVYSLFAGVAEGLEERKKGNTWNEDTFIPILELRRETRTQPAATLKPADTRSTKVRKSNPTTVHKPEPKPVHPAKDESIMAMSSLGYKKAEATKLFDDLAATKQFDTVEEFLPILMEYAASKT